MTDTELVDYESLAESFNQALVSTLRKHSIASTFLDFWVPDSDPVVGVVAMADSARIAGRGSLSIRFLGRSIPAARVGELLDAVGKFAKAHVEPTADGGILHLSGMSPDSGPQVTAEAAVRAKATGGYWHIGRLPRSIEGIETLAKSWPAEPSPAHADVHPHFRPSLARALAGLTREGPLPVAPDGSTPCEASEGTARLSFVVDSRHVVRTARHAGATAGSERAALDLFCRAAEGLPFQEVADHVGLVVVERLVDPDQAVPVPGILLPANAGPAFTIGPRLARKAYEAYRARKGLVPGDNFYYAPPSARWLALTSAERRDEVLRGIKGFLQSENRAPDDIVLLRLENNRYAVEIRGVVGFADGVPVNDKPFLMRQLEARLRRDVEAKIELVADRARDSSPLRRLS